MKKVIQKLVALSAISVLLTACSTFFDKDNTPPPTPLTQFTPSATLRPMWSTSTGSGSDSEYLKLAPAVAEQLIFTSSKNGTVTANDKMTGKSIWSVNTGSALSSGVSAHEGLVFVGTHKGELIALSQSNGRQAWTAFVGSEMLAPADSKNGITLAKSIDGQVTAIATSDGHALWHYQENEPNLILRGSSAPQISGNAVIVGFESGKLVRLNLHSGNLEWKSVVAEPSGLFAIQRMVDIDADPLVVDNRVYAATYQGQVARLELSSGNELWTHDISSYAGSAANHATVYVSDATSHLFAFNAANGSLLWEQKQLAHRTITGPALLGNYVLVGDDEGYLHVLSQADGHFVARVLVNSSGILATPVVNNNIVYVYTKNGHLTAYTVT